MTKILCPIDDTDASKPAIVLAARLARGLGSELTLLLVNELIGGYLKGDQQATLWPAATAERILADAAALARQEGAERVVTASIVSREVAPAICAHAADHGFDHIVIGSGGKGTLSRMVLGSVSRDVAARATCAVTLAR